MDAVIRRKPAAAQSDEYDLIVVGGGVFGASLALESVHRGLRPLLLEKADFGGATTANTLRIIHGGFRYLQSLDLRRFRRSVEQRRWWLENFPTLVQPMPCLLPLYGQGIMRPSVLRLALLLNDVLSMDRNSKLPETSRISRGRILDSGETKDLFPGCEPNGLQGGALWYDASMVSSQRLVIEMLRWTCAAGGTALNYVSARNLLSHGGRAAGIRAYDEHRGESLEYSAPVVVNAAGLLPGGFAGQLDSSHPDLQQPALAFNVLLRKKLLSSVAVGVTPPRRGAPTYFLRPEGNLTLAGTVHAPWKVSDGASLAAPEPLLREFLSDLALAVPGFEPSRDDVIRVFSGLLPTARAESAEPMKHPVITDHQRLGGTAGLFSASCVKFTTAPALACDVLDRAFPHREPVGSDDARELRPAIRTLMTAPPNGLDGSGCREFLEPRLPQLREIVGKEAVVCVEDLILRRLDWSLSGLDLDAMAQTLRTLLPEIPAGR